MSRFRNLHRIALGAMMVAVSGALTMGCSICAHPYDYTYTYYGARWQRSDMERGRVGSAFYPAGEQVMHDPSPMSPEANPNVPKDYDPAGTPNDPLQPRDRSAPTKSDEPSEMEDTPPPTPGPNAIRYRQDAQRAFNR